MTPLRVALLALDDAGARGLARELRRQPARRPVRVAVAPGAVVWTCAGWLAARLEVLASVLERAWKDYVPAYLAEMRESYSAHRAAWDALLARERVVLVCYCVNAEQCHRAILRGYILPQLGAVDAGEVAS